jgi:uncharacterized 2Fe-2S/4Fe-4S cluster protein (DUF4445 family)
MIHLPSRFEVVFQPDGRRGKFDAGTTVLEAAHELGVDINSICGGMASCGKCVVKILKGNLSDPSHNEINLLGPQSVADGYRLACHAEIRGDTTILVPEESRTATQRLQTEGLNTPVRLEPLFTKQTEDGITTVYHCGRVLEVLPSNESPILGFAVDVGTTKLAGYLINLSTGDIVSVVAAMNPEIAYGEDIITRLTYALTGNDACENLHRSLVEGIRQLLVDACAKSASYTDQVYETVFVGNTAMQHFLLNINPKPLTHSPFKPLSVEHMDLESASLGLGNPKGNIHVLPVIDGFVGADCVAAILATGIHRSIETCFLIDIGTNTEVVIGNSEKMVACSCASGPAFEGAHISHGMRAASGAIEGVWIDQDSLEPTIKTINNTEPAGICGSGLIDALSEMIRTGIVDTSGKIREDLDHPRIRRSGKNLEYVISWRDESASGYDIVLSQLDIRELQKGKAAMFSGAQIAMKQLDVEPGDFEKVYMAGAFGTYINRESAVNVGMIPEFPLPKIEQVGNAAGTGARMALISRSAREEAKNIRRRVGYMELASQPEYNEAYMDALLFPHWDLRLFPETVRKLSAQNLVVSRLHKRKKHSSY